MLFARMSVLEGEPEKIEEGIARFRSDALPQVRRADGFVAGLILTDKQTGRAMGLTLWTSAEAREATGAAMTAVRNDAGQAMGAPAPQFHLYEVPVYELTETSGGTVPQV